MGFRYINNSNPILTPSLDQLCKPNQWRHKYFPMACRRSYLSKWASTPPPGTHVARSRTRATIQVYECGSHRNRHFAASKFLGRGEATNPEGRGGGAQKEYITCLTYS